jgi:hypothetical protein
MRRSYPYRQGYRAAMKDAITFLHTMAASMNDPKAGPLLDLAADDLKHHARKLGAGRRWEDDAEAEKFAMMEAAREQGSPGDGLRDALDSKDR